MVDQAKGGAVKGNDRHRACGLTESAKDRAARTDERAGYTVKTGLRCTEIEDGKVTCIDAGGGELCLTADTVVYALGTKPHGDLACSFKNSALPFASVCDCLRAGKVLDAVQQGYYAALNI